MKPFSSFVTEGDFKFPSNLKSASQLADYVPKSQYWANPASIAREMAPNDIGWKKFIHASEATFGDYGGRMMLVGQDWAHADELRKANKGIYRTTKGWQTDKRMLQVFQGYSGVFINAMWCLKESKGATGPIKDLKPDLNFHSAVFNACIKRFKGDHIFILGTETLAICNKFNKSGIPLGAKNFLKHTGKFAGSNATVHFMCHPGGLGLNALEVEQGEDRLQVLREYVLKVMNE